MTHTHEEIVNRIKEAIDNQPIPPHYNPDEWHGKFFNCYAYAMRMFMDFDFEFKANGGFPEPGFLSRGKSNDYDCSKQKTLQYFKEDCETLGLQVIPVELDEEITENEYKIAVYCDNGYDFHFARQDRNGEWSEKYGWDSIVRPLKKQFIEWHYNDNYKCIGIFKVSRK